MVGPRMPRVISGPGHPIHASVRQLDMRVSWKTVFTLLMYRGSTLGAAGLSGAVAWPDMLKNVVTPGHLQPSVCPRAMHAPDMRSTSLPTMRLNKYEGSAPEYPRASTTLPTSTLSANGSR